MDEIQHRIEAGENDEDAFTSVLGKDQPGRLRCYGGGITKSSLKKDEAVRQVQVEYDKKVLSLQNQMHSMQGILKMVLQQLNPGMTNEDVAALVQPQQTSPPDASSRPDNTATNPRSFESTHLPEQE
ncbi:hypothetical protein PIB30_066683 [Stylosanthes scabra]|uniref:Uncharacterized protein n=1 Tax=Stylosanthes scabra TaxID=79078 RepID=A0ABU6RMC7_9FABA|nr:hypothetical protein [Stylosanthes scabra]